jgi:hypothetical protein
VPFALTFRNSDFYLKDAFVSNIFHQIYNRYLHKNFNILVFVIWKKGVFSLSSKLNLDCEFMDSFLMSLNISSDRPVNLLPCDSCLSSHTLRTIRSFIITYSIRFVCLLCSKTKSFTYEPYTISRLSSSIWRRLCLSKNFIHFWFLFKHYVFFVIWSSKFTYLHLINNRSVTDGKVHIEEDKRQGTTKLARIVLLTMVRDASMRRDADGTSWPHQSWQECWPSHKRAQRRISEQHAPCTWHRGFARLP